MPGPAAGEGAPAGVEGRLRLRDVAVPLGLIVALGLALRLIIAYVLLRGSGFGVDRASFNGWAGELAQHGPFGFYGRDIFVDYTPGYLYVLWLLGLVNSAVNGPAAGLGDLMKLPAIAADGLMAVVVCAMAGELGASRRGALLAAGLVLFNPVTWFDSAIWAQVDAIGTLVLLLAVRELWGGRSETAAVLATVAAITKPQFGILIPIAAAVILKRHLLDRPQPWRVVTTTLAGLVTATLVCLPFGLWIVSLRPLGLPFDGLLEQIVDTASGYPYVTVNAYNPWALVENAGAGLALHGTWLRDAPGTAGEPFLAIAGIPAVMVGTAFLLVAMAVLAVLAARRDRKRDLLVIMAVAAVVFFVFPTRVHERYLYPFFAFGAILAGVSPSWLLPYGVLATANLANLYGVLTWPFYENPGLGPMLTALGGLGARLGEAIRSSAGVVLAVVGHVAGLALVAVRALLPERASWAWATAPSAAPAAYPAAAPPEPSVPRPARLAGPHPAAGGVAAVGPPHGRGSGLVDRLLSPVVDRTVTLAREGGGRLDRMDLLLLVLVVVAALSLRVFRLDQPSRMHFDEVYHARTAAEFLQFWRYGEPHSIYEYTHPHLAKYAIAAGIVLFGDNRVVAESRLPTGVRDAAIEARWDDATLGPDGGPIRAGERLYLATGSSLRIDDLRTRARLAEVALAGARAVAVDAVGHRVFVGTASGEIDVLDSAVPGDVLRAGAADGTSSVAVGVDRLAVLDAPIERLWVAGDGGVLLAAIPGDGLVAIDASSGDELARTTLPGRTEVVDSGRTEALVARPAEVVDPAAVADQLTALLGGDPAGYEALLGSPVEEVTIAAVGADEQAAIETAITDGALPGLSLESRPRVAVAARDGVVFLEPASLAVVATVELDAPATGLARGEGIEDDPTLYAPSGTAVAVIRAPDDAADSVGPSLDRLIPMPGLVSRAAFNPATQLLHVLGSTPDGGAATVYVIEPRGQSVFADAVLPFSPVAWALDADAGHPSGDRERLLAFDADGAVAAVDTGGNAFAWRLPGVIAGALMAGLIYLLARILFRRRTIAVLAGAFALLDGMLFVQSRIAMNDAYVALFITAAAVLFAALWTGGWSSRRSFWLAMPAIGLLLGLALASKWVALYAIGGFGILVLARSALGRVLVVVGLAAIAGVLGYQAIAPQNPNWTFLAIMVALTFLAATVAALRPVAWTVEEVRFAVGAPVVVGGALALAAVPLGPEPALAIAGIEVPALLVAGVALAALGVVAYGAVVVAGLLGWGPLAPPPAPDDPVRLLDPPAVPPRHWLRLGADRGLPAAWMAFSLLAIPIVVYVISYLPWVALGNRLVEGWPPGNGGQTLAQLTQSMYDYHDKLRATHAASSPWWAWPLDLKPVWFFQGGYAGSTTGAIYDGGNLATWWLALPALAFGAWQAFRRRSLGLAFVVIMVAALWLPWSRIDRATFQYHYYAALPFVLIAVAYLVAEAWHGPSRRTWLLLRATAAVAVLGPALLWLALQPLCAFVDVGRANPSSWACAPQQSLGPEVSWQALAIAFVLVAGTILVGWLLLRLASVSGVEADPEERSVARFRLVGGLIGFGVALLLAVVATPAGPAFTLGGVPRELAALVLAVPLGVIAWLVLTAATPRRWALGAVIAAGLLFVLFWPNWTGLPLPDAIHNWYQLILPTWQYAFQFPVNMAEAADVPLLGPMAVILGGAVLLAAAFVAYSAWTWRLARAERAADEADAARGGPGRPAGA